MNKSCFFQSILLLYMIPSLESALVSVPGNETDRMALLEFKNQVTQDPIQIMSSWNNSLHFCNWVGVKCNPTNGRVMILNLEAQKLIGRIPPSIGNLTFLKGLNLKNNGFHGEIPQEIGRLHRLQHLNLSYNSFGGQIPSNLTHCTELTIFYAVKNELVGQIPEQLGSLSKLLVLAFDINFLSGTIPASLGNLSSLYLLSFMENNLRGSIPDEIGLISGLGFFQVYANELSGTVPSSIYNISSLYFFAVAQNNFHGQIPPNVGLTLPNIKIFGGAVNNFTGPIPVSLSNASQLSLVDFAQNSLTGAMPKNLGILQGLSWINFDDNILGNEEMGGGLDFLADLANCTGLVKMGFARNQFGGKLPNSIANLSTTLQTLTLGSNMIHGGVPNGIENLVNLTLLGLEGNYLNGSVPDGVGKLQLLRGLYLNVNRFSGKIPFSFGNLTSLTRLFMEENSLEGSIPPSLGNCNTLLVLNLSSNNLSGTIPKEVIGLSSLSISLAMSHNSLTGSIPFEVGNLVNLNEIDVSDNQLSGEIPSSLSTCVSLERLVLNGNLLQGEIPESLGALRGIVEIDFSHNKLSGKIPDFLGNLLALKKLDLSFNNFEGPVPSERIFGNASEISLLGNKKLCGGALDLHLPTCSKSTRKFLALKVVIPLSIGIFLSIVLCSLAALYVIKRSPNRPSPAPATEDSHWGISYKELVESTNGFCEANLIGSGSFGSVYKGILQSNGEIVAVKVLNLQQQGASKSFMDECKALRSIRHRNLLKIISLCSGIDHRGHDFKALVFEFMSNGNLDQWLHARDDDQNERTSLNITQRLNIAIDVASALEYLHHHCEVPIVHCDLKPSNVLLDDDLTAHIGDFGLASFLGEASKNLSNTQNLSEALKGSIGYIAPENGMGGKLSTLGDVYSYGILLLEMFTGKRPTDDIFKDGQGIHKFVAMALPDNVMDIVDRSILGEEEEIDGENKEAQVEDPRDEDCIASVMGIGLSCSNAVPMERIPMTVVVNKMNAIRDSFLRSNKRNRRKIK